MILKINSRVFVAFVPVLRIVQKITFIVPNNKKAFKLRNERERETCKNAKMSLNVLKESTTVFHH